MARVANVAPPAAPATDADSPAARWWALAVWTASSLVFTLLYLNHPVRPSGDFPGWWGWWDASAYRLMAEAIVTGRLDGSNYHYPLGYPLLGVPFLGVMPEHIFFVPTLLAVGTAVHFLFLIARRFTTDLEAFGLSLAAVLVPPRIASDTLVPPFNNTPVLACAMAVTYLFVVRRPGRFALIAWALVLPFLFHVRSLEWLLLSALAASGLALRGQWRRLLHFAAIYAGAFLVYFAIVGWVNVRSTGLVLAPYMHRVDSMGFFSFPILPKAFWALFATDGVVAGRQALSEHFPWLLLTLPGAAVFARRIGAPAWGLFAAIGALFVLYINFNDVWPHMLFHFLNQRYFVWPVSLGVLLCYLTFRDAWRVLPPGVWAALLLAPLCVYVVRLDAAGDDRQLAALERPSGEGLLFRVQGNGSPIDFVRMYGVSGEQKNVAVEIDGRTLAFYHDFYVMDVFDPRHLALARPAGGDITLTLPRDALAGETLKVSVGRLRWRWRWDERR